MTDDIVTELRWISNSTDWVKVRDWVKVTSEAADEIERLRTDCDAWKATAVEYMTSRVNDEGGIDPDWGMAKIRLAKSYRRNLKAVRGG